jgi:L-alanine-DL-glutamate epimerase-like enolase superfamily enzyme
MPRLEVTAKAEVWPIAGRFTISRGSRTEITTVIVAIGDGQFSGLAECVPYGRYGETVESVLQQIRDTAPALERGESRFDLLSRLKAGAARNGLDCALIDLEAKRRSTRAHAILGLAPPEAVLTCYTISLATPEEMASAARAAVGRPLLKLKLGGDGDAERLAAVREAVPAARLLADANEAWSERQLAPLLEAAARAGVECVEQPLPAGQDDALRSTERPVPVCADESAHTGADLDRLKDCYDAVNIKLDKAGGLTEALAMAEAAHAIGLDIMVGCMLSTSLSMAPAMIVAQGARWVDLDGPLLLARDYSPALRYEGSLAYPPEPALWG